MSEQPLRLKPLNHPPKPHYCPICGQPLKRVEGEIYMAYCQNRRCPAFGLMIRLHESSGNTLKVDAPAEDNLPLVVSDRQLNSLTNGYTPCVPADYYVDLQYTSKTQTENLGEAITLLCEVEKGFRSLPLSTAEREKAIGNLNRIAAYLQSKTEYAGKINRLASKYIVSVFDEATAREEKRMALIAKKSAMKKEAAALEAMSAIDKKRIEAHNKAIIDSYRAGGDRA
jgi:NAD-dependent DNA ligase